MSLGIAKILPDHREKYFNANSLNKFPLSPLCVLYFIVLVFCARSLTNSAAMHLRHGTQSSLN